MMCPYMKTIDGFEMHIGVNHLGKNKMYCSQWIIQADLTEQKIRVINRLIHTLEVNHQNNISCTIKQPNVKNHRCKNLKSVQWV